MYVHTVVFPEDEQDNREKNLIDKLVLSVFNDNVLSPDPISRIYFMTSDRHSGIDQQSYNEMHSIFHQNLTLLGKTFQSVYEQSPGFPKMYYAKNEGIFSFNDNSGNRLVLDRVE